MQLPLLLKLRIAIVLAVSILLFATLGWSFAQPWNPDGPITISMNHQPTQLVIAALVLALISTAIAIAVAGRFAPFIGPLAVPVGLSAWAVISGGMEKLLLLNPEISERSALFHQLATETIIWFAIILTGYLLVVFATRRAVLSSPPENEPPEPPDSKLKAKVKNKPAKLQLPAMLQNQWLRIILALTLTCILAIILLKTFAQSGRVNLLLEDTRRIEAAVVPSPGQMIFAICASFFLSALAAQKLFNPPLWALLPAPAIIAIAAYLNAAQNSVLSPLQHLAPQFILASTTYASALPVQYIGLGSLALLAGYFWAGGARSMRDYLILAI